MTQQPGPGTNAHQPDEARYSVFDRTGPFAALTSLIRQHADNPDIQPALDRETATQLAVMVDEGLAPALVAAMAATTGEILNEWLGSNTPRDSLLAGLEATTTQPGWSPVPEPALTAARGIVSDYASTPRPPDEDLTSHTALGDKIQHADMLNAGLMMCLELLRGGRDRHANAVE